MPNDLPPGRSVELPGRGTTFVRELAGPIDAPTLVLLHGWTATGAVNWFATCRPLARFFRVLMIDHRGHGRGLRPRGPFRLEDCADDVVALLDVLGIARAAAVGYSMGGPIAQLLWRRHPTRVEGLVLCATSRNFGGGRHARVFYGGLATGGAALTFAPAAMRGLIMDRFLKARLDDPDVAWMAEEYRYGDPALIMQAGGALGRFNSAPWISEVDVPTAVIVTTEDTVVSPERQRKLAAAIPRAVVFEVAGDHRSCVARPDLFVPQLVAACQHVTRRPPVR